MEVNRPEWVEKERHLSCKDELVKVDLGGEPQENNMGNPWPVAVFAHNEERKITACLASLAESHQHHPVQCFVLANGCTDGTEECVRAFIANNPWVHLISIQLGDKSNAWNIYVHEVAPPSDVHFFIDGDLGACSGALTHLYRALTSNAEANAAAAVPATGRTRKRVTEQIIQDHDLLGNLYALRGTFLDRVRAHEIRIPVGLIGEDCMVGALAKWNLDLKAGWREERIVPCPEAGFWFEPLSMLRPRDLSIYWKKQVRYGIRACQMQMIISIVKVQGLHRMPTHVRDLYAAEIGNCSLPWSGPRTFFNWIGMRRIRRSLTCG